MKRLIAAVLCGIACTAGLSACGGSGGTVTVRAEFASTPGLYVGNHVDVLGLPVGTVTKITPSATGVLVEMKVRKSQHVPVDASAVLEAPGVVNDRFVQLEPAWTSGPYLTGGEAPIPMSRTAVPLTTDAIIGSLDSLVSALGPTTTANGGAAATALHQLAEALRGNGSALNTTITSTSQLLDVLAKNGPGLASTLTGVDGLAKTLAENEQLYASFTSDLSTATTALAADSPQLGAALTSLQSTLAQVATFVSTNKASIASIVDGLQKATGAVTADQKALIEFFDTSALSLGNFAATADTTYPYGPVGRVRFDPITTNAGSVTTTEDFITQICGDETSRIAKLLEYGVLGTGATTVDLTCAANASLARETGEANAPTGPDLSLNALLAAGR